MTAARSFIGSEFLWMVKGWIHGGDGATLLLVVASMVLQGIRIGVCADTKFDARKYTLRGGLMFGGKKKNKTRGYGLESTHRVCLINIYQ